MNNKTVGTITIGCKVNTYDTNAMINILTSNGYDLKDFNDVCDVYIINTCSVTNLSERTSRQKIRKAQKLNPSAVIIATGCYSQTKPEEVSNIEGVDIIIGTKDRHLILDLINEFLDTRKSISVVSSSFNDDEFESLSISEINGMTRSYLKIQEGCENFCSYCIIPFARGKLKSRKLSEILDEVRILAENSIKEIILSGIHIASYGKDLEENITLIDVIENCAKIDGIERIRFSSIEPNFVTKENFDRLSKIPKVCDFFHLSLQSGSDKVLSDMNRKYNKDEYRKAIYMIKSYYKNASISTDVIVGYPTETEEHFLETVDFVKELKLSKIHVFPFSKKDGTVAAKLTSIVTEEEKSNRAEILRKVSDDLEKEFLEQNKGYETTVLFESIDKNGFYIGHTTNYISFRKKSDISLINKITTEVL